MASKFYAEVERKHCVACGTCLSVCPRQAIEIIKGCYAQVNKDTCVGCMKCGKACPTSCISTVER